MLEACAMVDYLLTMGLPGGTPLDASGVLCRITRSLLGPCVRGLLPPC